MPERFNIAIIGEAYGEEEAAWTRPFIGPAGKELDRILEDAGLNRAECHLTNVFNLRPGPFSNDLKQICVPKADSEAAKQLAPLLPGQYLNVKYLPEITRLFTELEELRPNVVILLGNTACWALLGHTGVGKIRGTACLSPRLPWLKCLPTYHPTAVLQQYDLRHVTVLDFIKAKREAEFPELKRPSRSIFVAESIGDIESFKTRYLDTAERIAWDVETDRGQQITCIGFAPTIGLVLVIPFADPRKPDGNYWPSLGDELAAWDLVADILDLPAEKVTQNGLYDMQYTWQSYGIPVRNARHDTMLLHHSLFPESEKGLGFLGSVYTNEASWKADRPRGSDQTIKRED